MLKVSGLKKSFGKVEVLKGVDLEVEKGQVLVVVGPSGGGKTTLIRCINGLEKADDGTIEICGKKLCDNGKYSSKEEQKLIRKDIGLVFQNFNLFPHMTVLENLIEAPQRVLGITKEEAIIKAKKILVDLSLKDKENSYPFELSGGQKQRVAIGRALAMEPKILCFDEPTSALDPTLTGNVASLINDLKESGITMIVITHDISFANNINGNIFTMESGKGSIKNS
ncbi:MAG: amino acid ABC transporter ATP-binding protein [Clostridiales bacterium]|nr:amino acid ABC transporter ATP-binding protein [Clostridiales bacterium]